MRLDAYCALHWPDQSRSTWHKLIKSSSVRINGEVAISPKQNVPENAVVTVTEPETPDNSDKTLPIIYEDDDVIVINKPVGVLAHAKGALSEEFTVADFFKTKSTYNADTNRPGIVHRLDRDTSGIMIGAKTPEAAHLLSKQFQDRRAKKTYIALVDGIPKEPEATIDLPIARNPKTPSTFRVDVGGKSAQTHYKILEFRDEQALVQLQPVTGRTHQLRVHMAYLGTPISGDRVYGKVSSRLFLHAWKLEITIGGSKRVTFEAPVPSEFNWSE